MADWPVTGSDYKTTGTNVSAAAYQAYSSRGMFSGGTPHIGWSTFQLATGVECLRIAVTPAVRTKSVSLSFSQTDNINGQKSSNVIYYARASASASAWPTTSDIADTSFTLASDGTKSITVPLGSVTDSTFYVYIWGHKVSGTEYANGFVNVTGVSNLAVTRAVPEMYVKTGASTWSEAKELYVKTGSGTWSEAKELYVKSGSSAWSEA